MRKIADTQKNQAAGLNCRIPWKVTKLQAMKNYRLQVEFADGYARASQYGGLLEPGMRSI